LCTKIPKNPPSTPTCAIGRYSGKREESERRDRGEREREEREGWKEGGRQREEREGGRGGEGGEERGGEGRREGEKVSQTSVPSAISHIKGTKESALQD
jgi:hypothetical protein